MNYITLDRAARAMGIERDTLSMTLMRCGIRPREDRLTQEEIETLCAYLREQEDATRAKAEDYMRRQLLRGAPMIDTCSLLRDEFPLFVEHLRPLLRECGRTLAVPFGVVAELRALASRKPELMEKTRTALRLLAALRDEGLVHVYGGGRESFADQQVLAAAVQLMTNTEVLVITQDNALSEDLCGLNTLGSVRGREVRVVRINRYGYLSRYLSPERRGAGSRSYSQDVMLRSVAPGANSEERIPVSHVPGAGETVFGSDGRYRLGAELAAGGEGVIYELDDGSVAKIYRPARLTVGRRDKVTLMAGHPLRCSGVCWPQEVLRNEEGDFLGYRMERARGQELQRSLFTRQALERNFPDWTRTDTVRLCVTILEKICALHRSGVILGDINPLNILVASPEEVFFVDCDSYQVGGYPCPVGTVRFTPPELQGKCFREVLRTPGNEAFAVATLLFMLMLPGKAPYAQQGGGDAGEAILAMDFPYPCGDNRCDKTPEGAWRFLWSHLPYYIKDNFWQTFSRGGSHSTEQTRLDAEKWLGAFRYYLNLLESGKLQAQDEQSGLIFPNRWKVVDPGGNETWQTATCVECGQEFQIGSAERTYFEKSGFALPKRCPTCRRLRRLSRSGVLSVGA